MPSFTIADEDLAERVRSYARAAGLTVPNGAAKLLELGLQADRARRAGAAALNASRSPEQRSEMARRAGIARQASRREADGQDATKEPS